MAWSTTLTNDTQSGITDATAIQRSSSDWVIGLNPGEFGQLMVSVDSNGTSGDVFTVTIFTSNFESPGFVPDNSLALADSEWARYTAFTVDDSDSDREATYIDLPISGRRWFSLNVERTTGSTNAAVVVVQVSTDGIGA